MSLGLYAVTLLMFTGFLLLGQWFFRGLTRDRAVDAFVRQLPVVVPDAIRAEMARRVALESWSTAIGTVLASALLLLAFTFDQGVGASPYLVFYFLLPGAVGPAVAIGISSVVDAVRPPPTPPGPRFARARALGVGDYVTRLELGFNRLGVLLTVAAVVVAAMLLPIRVGAIAVAGGFAGLAVVVLVLVEVLARMLLRASQPAGSETDLMLDDAVRGFSLQRMYAAPFAIAGWALLVLVFESGVVRAVVWMAAGVAVLLLGAYVTARLTHRVPPWPTTQQHFLRRLWAPRGPAAPGTMVA